MSLAGHVTTKHRATLNRHLNAEPFYIKERLSGEVRKMFPPPPKFVLLAVTRAISNRINSRADKEAILILRLGLEKYGIMCTGRHNCYFLALVRSFIDSV